MRGTESSPEPPSLKKAVSMVNLHEVQGPPAAVGFDSSDTPSPAKLKVGAQVRWHRTMYHLLYACYTVCVHLFSFLFMSCIFLFGLRAQFCGMQVMSPELSQFLEEDMEVSKSERRTLQVVHA